MARAQLNPPAAPIDRQTPPGRPHRLLWARFLYPGGSRETTSRGVPVPPSPPAPGTLRHSPLPARSSDSCRPAAPPDLGARFSRCLATTSRGLAARLQVARHLARAPPPAPLQPLSRRAPPEASFWRASVPWHVPGTPRTTPAAAAAPAAAPTPPLPPSDYTPSPAPAPARPLSHPLSHRRFSHSPVDFRWTNPRSGARPLRVPPASLPAAVGGGPPRWRGRSGSWGACNPLNVTRLCLARCPWWLPPCVPPTAVLAIVRA